MLMRRSVSAALSVRHRCLQFRSLASLKEQITALREATGSGMVDCKKALTSSDGSFDDALAWLREKGLASASKKAGRSTSEGLVAVAYGADGRSSASLVEVNCETDFVAKTEIFQELVSAIAATSENLFLDPAALALDSDALLAALLGAPVAGNDEYATVDLALAAMVGRVGENLRLTRVARVAVPDPQLGAVASYVHKPAVAGGAIGNQAALVAMSQVDGSARSLDDLASAGRNFAMHVVAAQPLYLTCDDVPAEVLERERNILLAEIANEEAEALAAGAGSGKKARKPKPAEVIAKIVEGRVKKFMTENVLLEQVCLVGNETGKATVSALLPEGAALTGYQRFACGEVAAAAAEEEDAE